jgi:hypothetical protein
VIPRLEPARQRRPHAPRSRAGGRARVLFALLLGCQASTSTATVPPDGTAERASPPPVGDHEGEGREELRARLRRLTGDQQTLQPAASEDPAVCEDLCSLATQICGVTEKLCNLADAHAGDDEYQGLCRQARQECRGANDSCIRCVERHRDGSPGAAPAP